MKTLHPEQLKVVYYREKTRSGQISDPKFLEIYAFEED